MTTIFTKSIYQPKKNQRKIYVWHFNQYALVFLAIYPFSKTDMQLVVNKSRERDAEQQNQSDDEWRISGTNPKPQPHRLVLTDKFVASAQWGFSFSWNGKNPGYTGIPRYINVYYA